MAEPPNRQSTNSEDEWRAQFNNNQPSLPSNMIPPSQAQQPRSLSELLETSYNSWRYGEEASLYSIAEDSREERTSELASRCGTDVDFGGGSGTADSHNWGDPPRGGANNKVVELQWDAPDEEDTHFSESDGVVGLCATDDSASSRYRRSRIVLFFLLSFAFLLATVLGVVLSRNSGSASDATTPSKQVNEDADPGGAPTNSSQPGATNAPPTATTASPPLPAPTPSPTAGRNPALVEAFVKSSLEFCSDTSQLDDPTSLQYEAYQYLLDRIRAASSVNSQGVLDIPLSMGQSYVAETFGLIMVYLATGGPEWSDRERWLSGESICEWRGVGECVQRREGSCQVEDLALNANNLVGELPDEVCCMICLTSLNLSNNRLKSVPSCLLNMNMALDTTGNDF